MITSLRSRGWIVAILIFLLGLAVGSAGTLFLGARALRTALKAPAAAPGFIDRAVRRVSADLTDELKLTPEESVRARRELQTMATNMKLLRIETARRFTDEAQRALDRIAAGLPPEKQNALRELAARRFSNLGLPPPATDSK